MPQKKKLTQAQRRAVNNRSRIKNSRALIANPRPTPPRNVNTFRNTRQTSNVPGNRMTVRQKGTYALAEVSAEPLQMSISPYGIHRFSNAYSALSMAFASHEQYFVHTVSIEFIPELAVTEPGSIHLSPDYDPLDPMPADVTTMSSDAGYKSGAVTQKLVIAIPNLRTPDGSFTRPMLYSSPNVIERLSDYALVNFRTTGVTATGTIGRLILHYDISFHIPQVPSFPESSTIDVIHTLTYTQPDVAIGYARLCPIETEENFGTLVSNALFYTNHIFSAIIETLNGLTLTSVAGRAIAVGSRIFFRGARHMLTTNAGDGLLHLTSQQTVTHLGELNLSRAFDALTELILFGSTGDTIGVSNVVRITG